MIGDSNDETNFPHRLLLSGSQVSKPCSALAINLSANIKLSISQLPKMIQVGEFLSRLLGPVMNTGLPLIKNAL